jgi:HAD superfamily hydrolase (TIGR01509 family)
MYAFVRRIQYGMTSKGTSGNLKLARRNVLLDVDFDEDRGLVFDAHGVLYYRPHPNRRLNHFLAPYGLGALPVEEMRRRLGSKRDEARTGKLSLEEYCREKLRAYGVLDPEHLEIGVHLMLEDSADIALFPGTSEALYELRDMGFKLAIVTDSAKRADVKLGWLERRGLARDLWTAVISSHEAGVCKPAAEIYVEALDRMEIEPSCAGFVGHATDELEGAAEIGMTTIAFRPDDPDVEADVYVDDLRKLLELFD